MKIHYLLAIAAATCGAAGAQAIVTTIVGGGTGNPNGVPATSVRLALPRSMALDAQKNLYFVDLDRILRLSPDGNIMTVAGGGSRSPGDGGPATAAQLEDNLGGLAIDSAGNLFFTDTRRVRRVSRDGILSTIAGTLDVGFSGDGGPAVNAQVFIPRGLAFDPSGNLFFADSANNRVRKVASDGTITTFAGNGEASLPKDGVPALQTGLDGPTSLLYRNNQLYILWDIGGISKVGPDGTIRTVVDFGVTGGLISDFAFDPQGAIYAVDEHRNRIYRQNPDGATFNPIVGTGDFPGGFGGDWGPPANAMLYQPSAILIDSSGVIYFADTANARVRVVAGLSGLGVPQSAAILNGASFQIGQPIAAGSLISIFGTALASRTAPADSVPLSTVLANVAVRFVTSSGSTLAPLLYVTPDNPQLQTSSQINAQVPWHLAASGSGTVNVIVIRDNVPSQPLPVAVSGFSPGVFASNGRAIAVNNADGVLAWPSNAVDGLLTHPAQAGDVLILYVTGLGAVDSPIADGANSLDKLRSTLIKPVVLIGGISAKVLFAGLSPQFVGVNQINVIVPNVASGDNVPVQLEVGGTTTANTITIAVR